MDWSYVAGYFDGEGHVQKRGYGIGWTNSHHASLVAIRDFIACGHISARRGTNMPVYNLKVGNLTDLRRIVPTLIPHTIVKREQLQNLLDRTQSIRAVPNYGTLSKIGAEDIRRLYWDEELSCQEIGERVGVTSSAVEEFLRLNGGGVRTQPDAMAVARRRGRLRGRFSNGGFPMEGVSPEIIRSLYWGDGLSARAIGLQYGLTREGMRAYMIRHAIPFRPRGKRV